jgi:protein-arginine kinase activator protein McsA
MKICSRCHTEQPVDQFYPSSYIRKDGTRNLSSWCKTCTKQESAAYQKENPGKVREWGWRKHIRQKYGLTADLYQKMFAEQNGVCAICGESETHTYRSKEVGYLAIDHDHVTGKVRQLLCFNCNTGLGRFNDDPELLKAAIKYLQSHSAILSPKD